jgi:hypothetical protein
MENQDSEAEDVQEKDKEEEAVSALTAHFRRASRGRIVDLPRWAQ